MPPRAKQLESKTSHVFAKPANGLATEQATYRLLNAFTSLPDPDGVLSQNGLKRADLRRLIKDDEITQCLDKRVESIISTPWRLEPNQSRASKWLAQELAPHMEKIQRGAMEAVPYGYSVIEITYARKAGRIGIAMLDAKPFEWFKPDNHGGLRYFPSDGTGGMEGIPCDPRKFFLTAHQPSYRNPYGEALLSRLWWPVVFRTNGWRFWAQFLERFGMPLMLGKTSGDREAFTQELNKLATNAVAAINIDDEISAVESGKDGQQFTQFENAVVARIQKTILGQTLTSQVDGKGSYAAAQVHYQVMQDKRNADIRMVSATCQRMIDTLCDLNGLGIPPKFTLADNTGLEMERAQRDALLVEKGILKFTPGYLMDRYDFAEGDFEVPETPKAPEPTPPEPEKEEEPAEESEKEPVKLAFAPEQPKFTAKQTVIEDQIEATLSLLPSPISDAQIKTAIAGAADPADLEDRLAVLLAACRTW